MKGISLKKCHLFRRSVKSLQAVTFTDRLDLTVALSFLLKRFYGRYLGTVTRWTLRRKKAWPLAARNSQLRSRKSSFVLNITKVVVIQTHGHESVFFDVFNQTRVQHSVDIFSK